MSEPDLENGIDETQGPRPTIRRVAPTPIPSRLRPPSVVVVIDGPSFTLGLVASLPVWFLLDHWFLPWFVDRRRRHGGH